VIDGVAAGRLSRSSGDARRSDMLPDDIVVIGFSYGGWRVLILKKIVLDEAVATSGQLAFLLHRPIVKPPHGFNVARFAEHFPKLDRWLELLRYICARITAFTPLHHPPIAAIARGSLRC
jgi:hypothetical protein